MSTSQEHASSQVLEDLMSAPRHVAPCADVGSCDRPVVGSLRNASVTSWSEGIGQLGCALIPRSRPVLTIRRFITSWARICVFSFRRDCCPSYGYATCSVST